MHNVCVGLVNPKSPSNVAVILRVAGCFGIDAIFYTGKRYDYAKQFNEDTKNIRFQIPNSSVSDLIQACPEGASKVVVELTPGAQSIVEFEHPNNAYYIFGPEDGSVPQSIIDEADSVIYIPTFKSLNLAMTANVVMYDRLAKSKFESDNNLIMISKDNNNRTKVKKNRS